MNIIDYLRQIICILDGIISLIIWQFFDPWIFFGESDRKCAICHSLSGAGIAGSIISVAYYSMIGQDVLSAGASGAIFGLVGALAAIFLFCKEQRQRFDGFGIFLMIAGSLYHGFQSGTTDNAAHIGGCIAGFILSMLLYVLGSLIAAHKQGRSV